MSSQQSLAGGTVFSVLYNESDDFLPVYIRNFLGFTGPEAALVINLGVGREIRDEWRRDRVLIINGSVPRRKLGHTLLVGHLESFRAALEAFPQFAYFCSVASNSLFARRFDQDAAIASLSGPRREARVELEYLKTPGKLPTNWWWHVVSKSPEPVISFAEKWNIGILSVAQIEGLYSSRRNWGWLHDRFFEVLELGDSLDPHYLFPVEEIIPPTCFNMLDGLYTHVCHVFWDRGLRPNVEIDDILDMSKDFPRQICMMKWFNRTSDAIETSIVATPWCQTLVSSIGAAKTSKHYASLVQNRILLEQVADALRRRERYEPLTRAWPAENGSREWSFHLDSVRADRQILTVPLVKATHSANRLAFLFFESTELELTLSVGLIETDETRLSVRCSVIGGRRNDRSSIPHSLQGYLYINPLRGRMPHLIRMRTCNPVIEESKWAMSRIARAWDGRYAELPPVARADTQGSRESYFLQDVGDQQAIGAQDDLWLGIPFCADCDFTMLIDLAA